MFRHSRKTLTAIILTIRADFKPSCQSYLSRSSGESRQSQTVSFEIGQILSHVYDNAASAASLQVSLVSLRWSPCKRLQSREGSGFWVLFFRVSAAVFFVVAATFFFIAICFVEGCVSRIALKYFFPFKLLEATGVSGGVEGWGGGGSLRCFKAEATQTGCSQCRWVKAMDSLESLLMSLKLLKFQRSRCSSL